MPSLVIDLTPSEEQTAFNLQRWAEIHADPEFQNYQGRIETDRYGNIIMSPPANFRHGRFGSVISRKLEDLMPHGIGTHEAPINTPDGVRVADAVWVSLERLDEAETLLCLQQAPEICVEVLSPRNRLTEMKDKKTLYFAAGAIEVWFCDRKGRLTFFLNAEDPGRERSTFCPAFPNDVSALTRLPHRRGE
ncbi:MAG TPA: Uma2 family endonuclease [Chthoniobacteraceae bacterium]|jgi:Uma2 family endonuclease|nr:Uma2 family endonuclease [Chthoniobacteraceae bacterium]